MIHYTDIRIIHLLFSCIIAMTTIGREAEKNQQNNVYQMQKTTKMKRLTRSTSSYKIFILAEICTATKWKYNKVHARFVCFDLNGPGRNGRGSHVSDIAIVIPETWQYHFLSGVLIPPPTSFSSRSHMLS